MTAAGTAGFPRVLHVATAPGWRGGERQVWWLLRGLAERGAAPVLATPPDGVLGRRARGAGIRVVPLSARGDLDLVAAWRLRRVLGEGYDILHLHTGRAHALGLWATAGLRSRPRVVVARRVDFGIKGGPAGRLKYGPRVDRFVAVSRNVARVLERDGVDPARIRVVHSGLDTTEVVPADPAGVREELGVPSEAGLALYAGALVAHKAPDVLMRALAHLPPERRLAVAGRGPLRGELEGLAAAGHPDRVLWLGQRHDVPRLLAAADVFVLPSREEGLGTAVLDAFRAGTPVVGSRAGGIPEMVEDGVSGLLVPPEDPQALAAALERVLADPALGERLAAGGRGALAGFTAERMVERTLEVYRELAERPPGGG